MKTICKPYLLALAATLLTTSSGAEKLSVERIYSSPALEGDPIQSLKISPDAKRVTFLQGKASDFERLDLWEYNIDSAKTQLLVDSDDLHQGAEQLSDEEKARRERMRLSGTGIVSYEWSQDGKALLFPLAGDIYFYALKDQKARKIVDTEAFETDVKFSPKGRYASYIRDQNIVIFDLQNNREIQLTTDGKGPIKNGMAEFIAQEEMDRMSGYWWSPDESKIAFLQVDESGVEEVSRSEIYAEDIKIIQQRYPFAGKPNVRLRLGIIEIAAEDEDKIRWINLGKDADIYIPRVDWMPNSKYLSYQLQSRNQQSLKLMRVALPSLKQKMLLEETSKTWVNLHHDLHFLESTEQFIWSSERDGFNHLYLYNNDGSLLRQLSMGPWSVDALEAVDEAKQRLYFSGRKDTPLEKHIYSLDFKGKNLNRISKEAAYHNPEFSKNAEIYVDNFSSATQPPQVSLHDNSGKRLNWLRENSINDDHPLKPYQSDWIAPEFGSFFNKNNTKLYYRLYKPANFSKAEKYPVLVYVYGGPGVQVVANKWSKRDLLLQHMAQSGYVVFSVDNRGSKHRGKLFEEGLYQAMGTVEIEDQIAGVRFLKQKKWVDETRIGIHGHSYGGYMTLMAMFKAPDVFAAGVAGAPVTDWGLYDTHYTERYMGHPQTVPEAYKASSVFPYATALKGDLLIYHGMADDNVLFKNSTKLYKLLQDNNLPFMVMDYPGKKHSIRGKQTEMHRANMIRNFFDLHFGRK